jgi:hypothetical protein
VHDVTSGGGPSESDGTGRVADPSYVWRQHLTDPERRWTKT